MKRIGKTIELLILVTLCLIPNSALAQEKLKMTNENGVYTIPCEVNGLRMRFILDTGASSVCISSTEALFMLKNGYLDEDDIKGMTSSQIANGDIVENVKINLKQLKIGSIVLKNITATVMTSEKAPLLLGMSVINRLGSWTISNDYLVLNDVIDQNDKKDSLKDTETPETEDDLLNKQGVEYGKIKDYKHAFECFQKAASHGHPRAKYNLALCYYNGWGIKKDLKQSFYWLQESALSGYSAAQYGLGDFYLNGFFVEKNSAQCIYWFTKAAEQDHIAAMCMLADIYLNGTIVQKDDNKAAYWFEKAANMSDAYAQYSLSHLYRKGLGVIKNDERTIYWLEKSAQQGEKYAQIQLAHDYDEGIIVAQNYQLARSWFEKAADAEDKAIKADAQNMLSLYYMFGNGVDVDNSKALYWLLPAAENGSALAQYNLGIFYLNGNGVPKSQKEAKRWFKKAAAQGYRNAKVMLEKM